MHLTADGLFEMLVYFASVVAFVEISGIQICGWPYEVSELSAYHIVSVKLACAHPIVASSRQLESWVWELVEL